MSEISKNIPKSSKIEGEDAIWNLQFLTHWIPIQDKVRQMDGRSLKTAGPKFF